MDGYNIESAGLKPPQHSLKQSCKKDRPAHIQGSSRHESSHQPTHAAANAAPVPDANKLAHQHRLSRPIPHLLLPEDVSVLLRGGCILIMFSTATCKCNAPHD